MTFNDGSLLFFNNLETSSIFVFGSVGNKWLFSLGGSTIRFSIAMITIRHNCFRTLFNTVRSQYSAYVVNFLSSKSINGCNI